MRKEPLSVRERVRRRGVLVLIALFCVCIEFSATAADFYVSPTGTASTGSGTGTLTNPWALQTALSQPAAVHPGDTLWLRGGTYTGNFTSHLAGTASQPIVVRQYPGERATVDGNGDPTAPIITVSNGGYVWFMGFEVMNSYTVREDLSPGTMQRGDGFFTNAPGVKIINCVIHDAGQGITSFQYATNHEIYGNLIYYNGWTLPDRGHGHGIYVQNPTGSSKLIKHNILGDVAFPDGCNTMQAYGSSNSMFVNSSIEENVWYRADTYIGGLSGFSIAGSTMTGNYVWDADTVVGYRSQLCNPSWVTNNYFVNLTSAIQYPAALTPPYDPLGRVGMTISGNTLVGGLDGFSQSDYPGNAYYTRSSPPTANKVVVLPNTYEAGRATIVVYNWSGSATQAVDLTGVVSPGAAYQVRNAQNFYGPLVASGTYSGGSITLPMTALTPSTPVGFATPAPTGPGFNTFVVLSGQSGSPGPPAPPNALFTYSPVAPTANAPVTFTDTSTGSPTTWQWNFGDGSTSTQRNPTHTYVGAGTYTVTLTAANGAGSNQTSRSLGVTLRSIPPKPSGFYTVPPCRSIDTRKANGTTGGPILAANAVRIFPVAGSCGIPVDARTVSANLTVTGGSAPGALHVYPTDIGIPVSSAISFRAGQARSNIAMPTLATDGTGTIGVKNDAPGAVHLILDVNGYFK